ncbi:hypothetical protein M1271_05320 [Patescibacteria group bacterium]|nr:hypothetical protein [Patescibacteria group bacterium]
MNKYLLLSCGFVVLLVIVFFSFTLIFSPPKAAAQNYLFGSTGGNFFIKPSGGSNVFQMDSTGHISVATINASNLSSGAFGSNTGGGNYSFSGNVGIGTVTPGYKLDVQGGDINVSGNLREAGSALSGKYAYVGGGNALGTWGINVTGNAATVTNGIYTTNIGSYAPSLTGSGASGTWGINVTGSAGSVAWGNVSGKPYPINGQSWNWSGQGGQPTWLWGSNDGTNMYVWNPSNFSVNNALHSATMVWGFNVGHAVWTTATCPAGQTIISAKNIGYGNCDWNPGWCHQNFSGSSVNQREDCKGATSCSQISWGCSGNCINIVCD